MTEQPAANADGPTSTDALVALGSNVGDRAGMLRRALAGLGELGTVTAVSSIYETEPVGGPPGQDPYLNAVVVIRTDSTPLALLHGLLALEYRLGRVRGERWGPRSIDLDLLAHGDANIDDPVATIPHPRLHHRPFVLVPLREVAPGWRHPVTGESVDELLAPLDSRGVRPSGIAW